MTVRFPAIGLSIAVVAGSALLAPSPAEAQLECSQLSEPALLLAFSDDAPPGTITPQNLRDLICSVYPSGTAVQSITVGTGLASSANPILVSGTVTLGPTATHTVLANLTGGTAIPGGATVSALLDATLSNSTGSIIFRNSLAWVALGVGSPGQSLTVSNASTTPTWSTIEKSVILSWNSISPVVTSTQPIWVSAKPTDIIIDSVDSITAGSGTPAFTVQLIGTPGTLTCGGSGTITVGTVEATATCTANNTLAAGGLLNAVLVVTSGTNNPAGVQVNYHVIP